MSESPQKVLNVSDHSRDSAGMRYVYPVVSRRAGGVSIGINLNTNNACNWACIYCQVPNLTRGGPPPVDLTLLEQELRAFLVEATTGNFMAQKVPQAARKLVDVAFSGNGEPTSADEFPAAVEIVGKVLNDLDMAENLKIRLITNGSLLARQSTREGIQRIGKLRGEVWFKVDRVGDEAITQVNGTHLTLSAIRTNIERCAALAPTWVQTCYFTLDGRAPDAAERAAYLNFLNASKEIIQGVYLYGLARPSMQADAHRLGHVEPEVLDELAAGIAALGLEVRL